MHAQYWYSDAKSFDKTYVLNIITNYMKILKFTIYFHISSNIDDHHIYLITEIMRSPVMVVCINDIDNLM